MKNHIRLIGAMTLILGAGAAGCNSEKATSNSGNNSPSPAEPLEQNTASFPPAPTRTVYALVSCNYCAGEFLKVFKNDVLMPMSRPSDIPAEQDFSAADMAVVQAANPEGRTLILGSNRVARTPLRGAPAKAGLWDDGVWKPLPGYSTATFAADNISVSHIESSSKKAVIVGDFFTGQNRQPILWEYELETQTFSGPVVLPLPSGMNWGSTSAPAILGDDVYVPATVSGPGKGYPIGYWKNQEWVPVNLPWNNGSGKIGSALVHEGEVVFAGEAGAEREPTLPGYWKSGTFFQSPIDASINEGRCFFESAKLAFISGEAILPRSCPDPRSPGIYLAGYTLGGRRVNLPPSVNIVRSGISSIQAVGTDIYAAGYVDYSLNYKPVYWINQELHELPVDAGGSDASVAKIIVHESN